MAFGTYGPHDLWIVKATDLGEVLVRYCRKITRLNVERADKIKGLLVEQVMKSIPGNYPGIETAKLSKGLDPLAVKSLEVVRPTGTPGGP